MSTTEHTEQIAAIKRLPEILESVVKGLNDAQLDTPYREGGWTVRQVVHHLADSHMNAFIRMKLIITEDRPTLKPYNQDTWAALPDSRGSIEPSMQILRGLHERWASLLAAQPDSAWTRAGMHPENGEVTIEKLLGIYSRHGVKHVGHIQGLRTARHW